MSNSLDNLSSYYLPNTLDGINIISDQISSNALLVDGSNFMLADLNINNHLIKNLDAGIDANDAVNLNQLNGVSSASKIYADTVGNNVSSASFIYANSVSSSSKLYTDTVGNNVSSASFIYANSVSSSSKLYTDTVGNNVSSVSYLFATTQSGLKVSKAADTMSGQLTLNFNNASLDIRTTDENQDSILYLSTPYQNGATNRRKTAIIADGISNWNRANLHFCLNQQQNHDGVVSVNDSRMCILNGGNVGIGTTAPSEKLDINGNTIIRGSLNMNTTNKIINLSTPTSGADATNKDYVDTHTNNSNYLLRNGTLPMTGNLNLNNNYINNVQTPSNGTDATNKNYVDDQDNLKVNRAGDTLSGDLRLPMVRLIGQTVPLDFAVDETNRTNTYIYFESAGATSDWAYLRQIGSSDNIHIALDFHNNTNDGNFSLRSVNSNATPDDAPVTFFKSNPTQTNIKGLLTSDSLIVDGSTLVDDLTINNNLTVGGSIVANGMVTVGSSILVNGTITANSVIVRNAWSSGELIKTTIFSRATTGVTKVANVNPNTGLDWLYPTLTLRNTPNNSIVVMNFDAPYHFTGAAQDTIELYVYDTTGGTSNLVFAKSQYYDGAGGGGTRSGPIFPFSFSHTPSQATTTATRTYMITLYCRSTTDTLKLCQGVFNGTVINLDYYTCEMREIKI